MLALDLDLEADLGIDTVKQAELFATIREHYGIERDDQLKLRDYPTLDHVIGFVRDRAPDHRTPPPTHRPPRPARRPQPSTAEPAVDRRRRRSATSSPSSPNKTGYPADMLALDLDLEADLGIDTVKQAELFATIREHYGIERDDQLKLRDYPTLAHVIGFVHDRTPTTTAPRRPRPQRRAPAAATATVEPGPSTDADVEADILALVADKTGYPADMLALDLDLEADLGIDTVKQAEVFATIREHYGIERDDQLKLRDYPTLAHVIGFVRDPRPHHHRAPRRQRPHRNRRVAATSDVADVTEADRFPRRVPSLTIRPTLEACTPRA